MKQLRKLAIVVTIFLASCTTIKEVPVIVPVPILPLPTLPTLTQEQENQIPEDSYLILVERDEVWHQHVLKINKLIAIHNSGK